MLSMNNTDDLWNFRKCKLCKYRTRFLHNFLSHMRQHRTRSKKYRFVCDLDPPEKYQCEKCNFQYDLKVTLTKHFDTIHRRKETDHYPNPAFRYCKNCAFQTYSSLLFCKHKKCCSRNENTSLEYVKRFKSENSENNSCVQVYGTPQNVVERLRAKIKKSLERKEEGKLSQPNQKKMELHYCCYCAYSTYYNAYLKNHIDLKHSSSEINWLKCDHCLYSTIRNRDLQAHIRQMHTSSDQIIWLKCEHCSYQAKQKWNLDQHILVQHPETLEPKKLKFFRCDRCSYKTIIRRYLKNHIRREHTPSGSK